MSVIVDDLFKFKFNANEKTIQILKELSQYESEKQHEDDVIMFNHICISTLWRRMADGKDVCLEVKEIKK